MPAVATRPISHVVRDDSGKVVKTLNYEKGDIIHDDDDLSELSQEHHHSISVVPHNEAHCDDGCEILNPKKALPSKSPLVVKATSEIAPTPEGKP